MQTVFQYSKKGVRKNILFLRLVGDAHCKLSQEGIFSGFAVKGVVLTMSDIQVGRVLRVGRGWVDLTVDRKTRRISMRPDLSVRPGSTLQIVNDQAVLPSQSPRTQTMN